MPRGLSMAPPLVAATRFMRAQERSPARVGALQSRILAVTNKDMGESLEAQSVCDALEVQRDSSHIVQDLDRENAADSRGGISISSVSDSRESSRGASLNSRDIRCEQGEETLGFISRKASAPLSGMVAIDMPLYTCGRLVLAAVLFSTVLLGSLRILNTCLGDNDPSVPEPILKLDHTVHASTVHATTATPSFRQRSTSRMSNAVPPPPPPYPYKSKTPPPPPPYPYWSRTAPPPPPYPDTQQPIISHPSTSDAQQPTTSHPSTSTLQASPPLALKRDIPPLALNRTVAAVPALRRHFTSQEPRKRVTATTTSTLTPQLAWDRPSATSYKMVMPTTPYPHAPQPVEWLTEGVTFVKRKDSPTLFCWAVVHEGGPEKWLMTVQLHRGTGIFGCHSYTLFADHVLFLGAGPYGWGTVNATHIPGEAVIQGPAPGSGTLIWRNTGVFTRAYQRIQSDGLYKNFDWSVKVDPDTVFIPGVLQQKLAARSLNASVPVYLVNCKRWHSVQGPLEVLSRAAGELFYEDFTKCLDRLKWKDWGEDWFTNKCLDFLGARSLDGFDLLNDMWCKDAYLDTGRTYLEEVNERGAVCDDGKAAFHPYKSTQDMLACLAQAEPLNRVLVKVPVRQ